ncbi:MAG: LysM peptidoglycan-binding domain-containing protein [Deltaproteobacteria bacterium]|nr:LysM peptidoglycan-binding domain-containing protein [Deltaproteobacteria bacterium]
MKIPVCLRKAIRLILISSMFVVIPSISTTAQEPTGEGEEDTYTISLVQTAEEDKEIRQLEDKRILAETYTVKDGDRIWQIFRERGLLEKRDLKELLITLKKLNTSLSNLDLIHPGETLIIPLTIAPINGIPAQESKEPPIPVSLEELQDLNMKDYTIQKGESVVKIIKDLYDIPEKNLYDEYLKLVQRANPDIEDLDRVHPGQRVRLPIYSPQIVRKPIEPTSPVISDQETIVKREGRQQLGRQLGEVITQIGEEWIQTGKHFIPLKSGGQINLTAESYPIINLSSGNKILVDLYHDMPENMASLITANWDTYRIVHLDDGDDLRRALGRILPLSDFSKIYPPDEPLDLGGAIPFRMTGDWVIKRTQASTGQIGEFLVITLLDAATPRIPKGIREYLEGLGVTIIDYPPTESADNEPLGQGSIQKVEGGIMPIIETLLEISGNRYSKDVDIPIYRSEKTDLNLSIKADIFLNIKGKDSIIDFRGLGKDIIALLKEHDFGFISFIDVKDPLEAINRLLGFLGTPFESKSHAFMASERGESKNIRLMVQGTIFRNADNQRFLATPLFLPQGIVDFLSQKGYRILQLEPL